jgi:hypothetical protein
MADIFPTTVSWICYVLCVMSGISVILWLESAIALEIAWFIGHPLCGFKT